MVDSSKRVFVSGSWPAASDAIRRILSARGMVPVTLEQNSVPGTTWVESIRHCVKETDMAVGLLDERRSDAAVFFELGMASAIEKPTLLVISPEYPDEALPMSGVPYMRTDASNAEAIVSGIEQILSVGPQSPMGTALKGKSLGGATDEFLRKLPQAATGSDFEKLIFDVVKTTASGTIARGSDADDKGVDLAVWSSDLEPTIGNPLLIECKQSLTSPSQIDQAVGRMLRSVDVVRNGYGLIVFHHMEPRLATDLPRSFPLKFIAAEDFIQGLRTADFASFVRGLRYPAANGK